jgi:hypothetical protein
MESDEQSSKHVDCREQFRPILTAYRKHQRFESLVAFPIWLFVVVAVFFHSKIYTLIGVGSFIAWCFASDYFAPTSKLECPACHQPPHKGLYRFCPECGSATITEGKWPWAPKCETCKKNLIFSKGRAFYTVRFCTHCGAHLDDKGL